MIEKIYRGLRRSFNFKQGKELQAFHKSCSIRDSEVVDSKARKKRSVQHKVECSDGPLPV